jgi:hypothetical protein
MSKSSRFNCSLELETISPQMVLPYSLTFSKKSGAFIGKIVTTNNSDALPGEDGLRNLATCSQTVTPKWCRGSAVDSNQVVKYNHLSFERESLILEDEKKRRKILVSLRN